MGPNRPAQNPATLIPTDVEVSSALAGATMPHITANQGSLPGRLAAFQPRTNDRQPWLDPYYDGLRLLLLVHPPPIELPSDCTVTRIDRPPGTDRQIEGKMWSIDWTDRSARMLLNNRAYRVDCIFEVYHKYDLTRNESNWRTRVAVKPNLNDLPPGGLSALELLHEVDILLPTVKGPVTKRCVLSMGRNTKAMNLSRPMNGHGSFSDLAEGYRVLAAHQFDWVLPSAESHARAQKHADKTQGAAILDREHFLTISPTYKYQLQASPEWFQRRLKQIALIGTPRCIFQYPAKQQGAANIFLLQSLGKSFMEEQPNHTTPVDGEQAVQARSLKLPAFTNSSKDLKIGD